MSLHQHIMVTMGMRTVYATIGLAGWLLLVAASMRYDVIAVEPKNGQPFTVRRIVWPWESDEPDFDLQHEGKYTLNRYGFFGMYGQGCERFGYLEGAKSSRVEVH